jgi:DNA-binding transcriptional ArsR family regulator
MADIFDVISDATRRDILALLLKRTATATPELSVSDLVAHTKLSQPTVSKQLKVLRDAGLVAVREDGQHRYYRLDTAPLASLGAWLQGFAPQAADSRSAGPRSAAPSSAASRSSGTASSAAPPVEGQSVLPEDLRAVAAEAGAAAASVLFRIQEAWTDLSGQAKQAAARAAEELRKRS